MDQDIDRILYSKSDINKACIRLGQELHQAYHDKNPVIVCVLTGGVFFTTDIVREMDCNLEMNFIDVSSYHGGTESSGSIDLVRDLDVDIKDRDIILMEDIVDTGRTLKYIKDLLSSRGAASVSTCALLDKPTSRLVEVRAEYVGFEIPSEFLVGYGLDYKGIYRNLPYIGILKSDVYT